MAIVTDPIREQVVARVKEMGLNASKISSKTGMKYDYIKRYLDGDGRMTTERLCRMLPMLYLPTKLGNFGVPRPPEKTDEENPTGD